MLVRLRPPALITVAASALAVAGALAPAQAASQPGWRITNVYGAPDFPSLQGVASSGAGDSWVSGTTVNSLVVKQWQGAVWQPITPPAAFRGITNGGVNDFVIGTSSPINAWLFPTVSGTSTTVQYALRWNGKAWTKFRLSSKNLTLATAVFGPANVWEFGQKPGSGASLGYGPAWVLRWGGSKWRPVSVPGTLVRVSAPSARDIWGIGPSAKTVDQANQAIIAMHWNGRSWRALPLPKLPAVSGHPWVPAAIVARSARDVWVEDVVSVNRGGGGGPAGVTLLHWNGHKWIRAARDRKHHYQPELASDGHGGLWLVSFSPATERNYLVHYRAGHWRRQPAPTRKGYLSAVGDLLGIPGTTSVWGIGPLNPVGSGASKTAIFKYGN